MKPQNIFCFIILLTFESNMIMNSCFAQSDSKYSLPGTLWEVTILNKMNGLAMLVHCKSKDDDLGEHQIGPGGNFNWSFRENFWQTTLYWCNFKSILGHASGEVFWPEKRNWLGARCGHHNCIWVAREDGISLRLGSQDLYQLMYPWK